MTKTQFRYIIYMLYSRYDGRRIFFCPHRLGVLHIRKDEEHEKTQKHLGSGDGCNADPYGCTVYGIGCEPCRIFRLPYGMVVCRHDRRREQRTSYRLRRRHNPSAGAPHESADGGDHQPRVRRRDQGGHCGQIQRCKSRRLVLRRHCKGSQHEDLCGRRFGQHAPERADYA